MVGEEVIQKDENRHCEVPVFALWGVILISMFVVTIH